MRFHVGSLLVFVLAQHVECLNVKWRKNAPYCTSLFSDFQKSSLPMNFLSRREVPHVAVVAATLSSALLGNEAANAEENYRPAKRPTAYRVDSTQPPTLVPVGNARKELKVLSELGKGYGTDKEAIIDDRVNLNNILNKAVFGSIETISSFVDGRVDETLTGLGYASFVCLGLPREPNPVDVDLAINLINPILQSRPSVETALGLPFCPLSSQSDLDAFASSGNLEVLIGSFLDKGIPESTINCYLPFIQMSKSASLKLLATAPEADDIQVARKQGLEYLSQDRRNTYVNDPEGFVALSQNPRFRLYADRSLLKDYQPLNKDDSPGAFFSERILVHETAAGAVSKYAVQHPDSLVLILAPTADLRFLQGINGRIARLCAFLNPTQNKVTDNGVTTILLNPTAEETLSKTRYLRLEIGTGPQTLQYQTKVADYLWFSSSPKVNLIPRLMNER